MKTLNKSIRIIILFALVIFAASCGTGKRDKNGADNNSLELNNKSTINLTTEQFLKKVADFKENPTEWVYLGDKPAIIDFWADWCLPCKRLGPVLESLAKEYEGEIYIYKVNTDKEREVAAAFGIRAIPSLLFIPVDAQPQMAQGALPKEELKRYIETILLKKTIEEEI